MPKNGYKAIVGTRLRSSAAVKQKKANEKNYKEERRRKSRRQAKKYAERRLHVQNQKFTMAA